MPWSYQPAVLYVADSGNGRVLRYQRPFEQQAPIRPDLVLGQASFFIKVTDATARTMNRPYGVALTNEGHLLVSDMATTGCCFSGSLREAISAAANPRRK